MRSLVGLQISSLSDINIEPYKLVLTENERQNVAQKNK